MLLSIGKIHGSIDQNNLRPQIVAVLTVFGFLIEILKIVDEIITVE